jgi:RNA polymerase sigma factor (sigma-70 family)
VSIRVPPRTPKQEAEEISQANYEALKEEIFASVRRKLRSDGIVTVNQADLEDAYQQGWQGLIQHIILGKPVTSLSGLLYIIVHRRALDIYRKKQEGRRVDLELDEQPVDVDIAEQLDDQEKLNRLLRRLTDRLTENERKGVTLCTLHGFKRPEAAAKLGIDRVVFERIMDSATKKMSGIVASIQARGCGDDEWARALHAYALGALPEDEELWARVHDHVDGDDPCVPCQRYVRCLQGLAVVLPPLLPLGSHAGPEAILAHLYRLFGGGHAAATGTSALQGSALAGTATATSGGGGLLGGAVAGGAVKVALIAGAAAIGVAAVGRTIVDNHHRTPPTRSSHVSRSIQPDAGLLLGSGGTFGGGLTPAHRQGVSSHRPVRARRPRDATHRQSEAHLAKVAPREFTFEQPPGTHPSAATASAVTPTRAPASSPPPRQPAHSEGTGGGTPDFSFEQGSGN